MIKSKTLFELFLMSLLSIALLPTQKYYHYAYAQQASSSDQDLSITLLHPHIEKAITDFYGYNRRYEIGDSKPEILEREGNIFTLIVRVDTFEGAHNNYFTELLTFTVTPSSVTLEEYVHTDFIK